MGGLVFSLGLVRISQSFLLLTVFLIHALVFTPCALFVTFLLRRVLALLQPLSPMPCYSAVVLQPCLVSACIFSCAVFFCLDVESLPYPSGRASDGRAPAVAGWARFRL